MFIPVLVIAINSWVQDICYSTPRWVPRLQNVPVTNGKGTHPFVEGSFTVPKGLLSCRGVCLMFLVEVSGARVFGKAKGMIPTKDTPTLK